MRTTKELIIWDAVTPVAVTSSTDATPIVVTATSHLLNTGDLVQIYGHTTNIAANGIYRIEKVNANSYKLKDKDTGADIAGSGGGAGASGVMVKAPKIAYIGDWRDIMFSVHTSGSFNGTFKIAGSLGKLGTDVTPPASDVPNFGGTLSKLNPYSFIQIINLDTAAAVNGATGVTSAGTDLNNTYEVNVNGLKYLCPIFTAWSAGTVTVKAQLLDNL